MRTWPLSKVRIHHRTLQIVTLNSVREKAVYTGPFQPTLNTEYENVIMNTLLIFSQVLSWMWSSVCWLVLVLKWYLLYDSSWSWCKYNSSWLNYREVDTDRTGWWLPLENWVHCSNRCAVTQPSFGSSVFSLSYLYNLLKQSSISLGVACSDADDVASDEVLNKRTGNYAHIKSWICNANINPYWKGFVRPSTFNPTACKCCASADNYVHVQSKQL